MKNIDFGQFIKSIREDKKIPQRLVAQKLDIDTSTLSKIELGERHLSIDMLKPLSTVLNLDFKDLQIKFITAQILEKYEDQPFFYDALEILIKKNKK